MSVRSVAIDVCKALAIFFVVLGHNPDVRLAHAELYRHVYLFHMPLFVLLSGMFSSALMSGPVLWRRVRALLQPFLVGLVISFALVLLRPGSVAVDAYWWGSLWATGRTLYNAPLWYLPAAAGGLVLLNLVDRSGLGPKTELALAGLFILALPWYLACFKFEGPLNPSLPGSDIGLPFSIDLFPVFMALYMVGRHSKWLVEWGRRSPGPNLLACVALAAVFFLAADAWGHPFLDLNYRWVAQPGLAGLAALSGCAFMLTLSNAVATWSPTQLISALAFIGRKTLFILILHAPLQNFVLKLVHAHALHTTGGACLLALGLVIGLAWLDQLVGARLGPVHRWFYPYASAKAG
jgi:fucose 4-O-acetylase-like acetyltransferase